MFSKIMKWCSGRHTMFASYFAVMGTILAWFNRLDVNFIMLIGAIQSFVIGHSIKEDWVSIKTAQQAAAQPNPKGGDDAAR